MDYTKIYNDLVDKAKQENRKKNQGIYYEAHHIIPRCMGGEGYCNRPHPNIVLFTFKEHLLAHKLLCKIYPENKKLKNALYAFMKFNGKKVSLREYERLKEDYYEHRKKNPHFWSDEARKKMSDRKRGIPLPDETKKRISLANKGKNKSEQTKERISLSRRKFDEKQADYILSLRKNGWSYNKIAKELKCNRETIKNTLILWKKI